MELTNNAHELAYMASVTSPDSATSPGADFLLSVQDSVNEAWSYNNDEPGPYGWDDTAHEIADSAVPIYTYQKRLTFTDLAAWQEDLSEWEQPGQDMDQLSSLALYMIAERLAYALFEELAESVEDSEADEQEQDEDEEDESSLRNELESLRFNANSPADLARFEEIKELLDEEDEDDDSE